MNSFESSFKVSSFSGVKFIVRNLVKFYVTYQSKEIFPHMDRINGYFYSQKFPCRKVMSVLYFIYVEFILMYKLLVVYTFPAVPITITFINNDKQTWSE